MTIKKKKKKQKKKKEDKNKNEEAKNPQTEMRKMTLQLKTIRLWKHPFHWQHSMEFSVYFWSSSQCD